MEKGGQENLGRKTDTLVPLTGEIGPEFILYKINSYIPKCKKPSWKDFSRSNRKKKYFFPPKHFPTTPTTSQHYLYRKNLERQGTTGETCLFSLAASERSPRR